MPGYANWRQLYQEEYFQLQQEGYDVSGKEDGDVEKGEYLPFPNTKSSFEILTEEEEKFWRDAYARLEKTKDLGLRKDFPYYEPETLQEILKTGMNAPTLLLLKQEDYLDRLKGAILGRSTGVILGKPLEMGFDRKKIREYLESVGQYPLNDFVVEYSEKLNLRLRKDCVPSTKGNVQYIQPDDDMHYTILSLLLAEQKGEEFEAEDIGKLWVENIPYHWCWCASRQAYWQYVNLEEGPGRAQRLKDIPNTLNPWRECIDGQIRTDMWGYLNPGNPEAAAKTAYRDCSFSLTKNGIYGGMFVAGCLAGAMTEKTDTKTILRAGLSVIPEKSRLAEAVRNVMQWYQETPEDWIRVCDKIYDAYGDLPFAATINNLAIVTLAILYGNLDHTKTITTAVMCGLDTDCNAGTAGSIVGAAVGKSGIEKRWYEPFNDKIKTVVASFGEGSISEIVDRIYRIYKTKNK